MTSRIAAILLAATLTACATERAAPTPTGAWRTLNPAQWDVDPAGVPDPVMPKAGA